MQEVLVYINKDGGIKIETKGFSGKQCIEATAELEKLLSDVNRKFTSEYYQKEQESGVPLYRPNA